MATADNVTTGEDPTKAVLSESGLHKKHLCDYVINVATGCRHGCKFCYVPSTPAVRTRPEMLKEHADVDNAQQEWGKYVLYRDGLGERLEGILERKRTWKETENGCGVVGISFGTDCYMDGRAGKITRNVVDALAELGPSTPWEVSAALFGDLHGIHVLHGPGEAYAHLDHLAGAGVVERDGTRYALVDADPDVASLFPDSGIDRVVEWAGE